MIDSLPWDDIRAPAAGYSWLRTDLSAKHRFWWGKAQNGWPVLLFELSESHVELLRPKRPKVNGLAIDLISLDDTARQGLIISLTRPSDADIFYRLCVSIIRAADIAEIEAQAVVSVLNHLERWQDFLSNARRRLLSSDEIRGLFAELTIIRTLVEEYHVPAVDAVAAWQGPLKKPQDFEFPAGAIEVKATGGSRASTVQISSEMQLQVGTGSLFLVAVELFDSSADPSATSLNDLARGVEVLVGPAAARTFRDRLAIAGYAELPDYDLPRFTTGRLEVYSVSDGFPSIRGSVLPAGISRVRYDLDLNAARVFLVPRISIWDFR